VAGPGNYNLVASFRTQLEATRSLSMSSLTNRIRYTNEFAFIEDVPFHGLKKLIPGQTASTSSLASRAYTLK
jgi:hypothetical protein